MTIIEVIALLGAGLAAGTINTVVGAGSLVTFPTLLALGYSPIVANVTNSVGLAPGTISGAIGYRRELVGQRPRAVALSAVACLGGLAGGTLLLLLPERAFAQSAPILILLACTLVGLQPRLSRMVALRRRHAGSSRDDGGPALLAAVFLTGIYGGYFGAAQNVILIALLSVMIADDMQRLNGLKNVIGGAMNGVAAALFIAVAPVAWLPAIVLAIGAIAGGQVGARVGLRLSPRLLRAFVIVVGTVVALRLLTT